MRITECFELPHFSLDSVVTHAFLRECAMGIFGKYVIRDVRDVTQDTRNEIQDTLGAIVNV